MDKACFLWASEGIAVMPSRNVRIDHKGRRRWPLRDSGQMYLLVRVAAPMLPHGHAAYAVAVYGNKLRYMNDEEMQDAIASAKAGWDMAPEEMKEEASRRAVLWESNPETQSQMKIFQTKALTKAEASLERTIVELARIGYSDLRKVVQWDANGVKLRASSELSEDEAAAVAEVSEVLGKEGVRGVRVKMHSKPEALAALLRYYAPEKAALALTQNNLNIRILVVDADGNALKAG